MAADDALVMLMPMAELTGHRVHVIVELVLKRWFGHAVQVIAPVDPNVSVTHPGSHVMQLALMPAPATAYEPTGHAPLHDAVVPMPERA